MTAIALDPIWVDDDAVLAQLCQRWQSQSALAIDTEFMRSDTFFPRMALIQVGDGQGCYLIDPQKISNFDGFKSLLLNPQVIKVLHSCSEDLEVFKRFFDLVPKPVFDTQLAAAIAGYGFSLGYANLVRQLLGVEIDKNETRSDWEQRPLSQAQLRYAALDVGYLIVAYGLLLKRLRDLGRLEWVQEDCGRMLREYEAPVDDGDMYKRVKQAWRLNRQQLGVLRELAAWREQQAKLRDVPRNRVVKERALWDMARYQPDEIKRLRGLEGMTARKVEQDGPVLLQIIEEAAVLPTEHQPVRLPGPLSVSQGELLKNLKQEVRDCAQKLAIEPEILMKKRDYEELLQSGAENSVYSLGDRLSGWRKSVIGDRLMEYLHQTRNPLG